jgi:hypothetical protein
MGRRFLSSSEVEISCGHYACAPEHCDDAKKNNSRHDSNDYCHEGLLSVYLDWRPNGRVGLMTAMFP